MQMLSDDGLNLRSMSDEELDAAWDLWCDLAQETNAFDPACSHGVLASGSDQTGPISSGRFQRTRALGVCDTRARIMRIPDTTIRFPAGGRL